MPFPGNSSGTWSSSVPCCVSATLPYATMRGRGGGSGSVALLCAMMALRMPCMQAHGSCIPGGNPHHGSRWRPLLSRSVWQDVYCRARSDIHPTQHTAAEGSVA